MRRRTIASAPWHSTIEPFTIDDPRGRPRRPARAARPHPLLGSSCPTRAGTTAPSAGYLAELVAYWRDEYDWRRAEATLNAFDNFLTEIDGTRVHFIHARSPEARRVAADRHPRVARLGRRVPRRSSARCRTRRRTAAIPPTRSTSCARRSPGTRSPGPTTERGWGPRRIAEAWATLMAGLGLRALRRAGRRLGLDDLDPARPSPIPSTWPACTSTWSWRRRPPDLDFEHLREDEQLALASYDYYGRVDSGYSKIQGTKPQTIGYAARRLARRAGGVDRGEVPHVERLRRRRRAPLHQGPAARQHDAVLAHRHRPLRRAALLRGRPDLGVRGRPARSRSPSGSPRSPRRSSVPPRHWAEQRYDIRQWTEMPRGGHFAAFEEGDLLVGDVREFFRPLRVRT